MNGNKYTKGIAVKSKKTGFTLVELLVALGIVALLAGLLVPALNVVRNTARDAKQRAQFSTIELGLSAFKNDYGDYPPSSLTSEGSAGDYCGAQKLAEALVGWDLLGFHPNSAWRSDGLDETGGAWSYDPAETRDADGDGTPDTLDERKGPYLELATSDAYKLGNSTLGYGLFADTDTLAPNTVILCDVFGAISVKLSTGKTVKAGAPILYCRANTSEKTIGEIYNVLDNQAIVLLKQQADGIEHPLSRDANQYEFFYDYIRDPKISARVWPYRPDSYILISAGADGLYGTGDDIRNFGN
jgi:prepilin-type N-terminal cleavage/methylation domain-containing protein